MQLTMRGESDICVHPIRFFLRVMSRYSQQHAQSPTNGADLPVTHYREIETCSGRAAKTLRVSRHNIALPVTEARVTR